MTNRFHVVLADPPWQFSDALRMDAVRRSSMDHYETMSARAICDYLDLSGWNKKIAADAILFLWTTNAMLLDGTAPQVARLWGFQPKQLITWVKGRGDTTGNLILRAGLGHYTRGCTEQLILATRGQATWLVEDRTIRNYLETGGGHAFLAPAASHSTKPEESYTLIERLARGPYLELFARKRRPGWTCDGLELPEA